jgi:hypothetical protein
MAEVLRLGRVGGAAVRRRDLPDEDARPGEAEGRGDEAASAGVRRRVD